MIDCDAGTLSISINGGELYPVFTGTSHVGDANVFTPAILILSPGRARLLQFSKKVQADVQSLIWLPSVTRFVASEICRVVTVHSTAD